MRVTLVKTIEVQVQGELERSKRVASKYEKYGYILTEETPEILVLRKEKDTIIYRGT